MTALTNALDPDLAGLPPVAGVRLRRWRGLEADLPAMWEVSDAARVADGELERTTLEAMTTYYRHHERSTPERDLVLAELDGRVVAYARVEWNDSNDGERWYEGVCNVHPAARRRGIGSLLLAWGERRRMAIVAEQLAAGDPPGRGRALTSFVFDGDRGGAALLERAGYVPFRRFATMRRANLDDLPEVPLPAGFTIRPVGHDRDALRRVFDADVEAFRDHFGWTEGSDERFAEFLEEPGLDPDLWVVAFDGPEIAGAILNGIHADPAGEQSGWLDSVFTRRPWRRRGLARALVARSLAVLHERGMTSASLGVDLSNPHQALGLYESCGFATISSSTAYRKTLPAVPLAADSLEVPR